ncbi:5-(carboxyamino)imidazole ribonucleotide mutase [Apilactobacillus kunkeei]|uniref:N5-carboxyaminoimidazole ribonucleotide mutase n=2 Tax=Apilactobacillus kunkeei TaxID=148814 RepID=A0AAC8WC32_9LACO|nr:MULTISPECIES: 5-(carboxyamino)imidazole ribonucleotide mutase [Apilactobacillus]ALJ31333.1 N5-carboxyaminoimidazole ribonucleotide mutase [Apilactobacillus kunkeei]KFJ15335.1 N5-carboxyaminoimidazole ribonucleotide mutase [Apilactobacillus kunkeei]KOY68212.1 N5-carboxyaminoimidazole ribonucleotide mutase [Apilactobacillus kunkeei]KOY71713.1 N5-carboxyaminoimidazole ribonucleotide mutase [Apilactobacillus kunkeei DSM 12361 = ATCC 700308]KPN81462.1 N5-carboxyaminoimidazole ribonucleotide muta
MDVAVVMGSISDLPKIQGTIDTLDSLGISYNTKIISAHRMPNELQAFGSSAKYEQYKVIIAAAGGAAHLPGMLAANTTLPVIGIPVKTSTLNGVDSLLSIVQMPSGVPVATVAIGDAGAKNAALLAAQILAISNDKIAQSLDDFRERQTREAIDSNEQLH